MAAAALLSWWFQFIAILMNKESYIEMIKRKWSAVNPFLVGNNIIIDTGHNYNNYKIRTS